MTEHNYIRVELPGVLVYWLLHSEENFRNPVLTSAARLEGVCFSSIGRSRRKSVDSEAIEKIQKFRDEAFKLKGTGRLLPFKVNLFGVKGHNKTITRELNLAELHKAGGIPARSATIEDRAAKGVVEFAAEHVAKNSKEKNVWNVHQE